MAMTFGSPEDDDAVLATINTTPLVDVMLVLLIIFLLTSPVVLKTIPIKLPAEHNQLYKTKPDNIIVAVAKDGSIYWNQSRVANTDVLLKKLKEVAVKVPQPELHIRGDQEAPYEFIGRTVLAAQRAGIAKVSFIIQPPPRS